MTTRNSGSVLAALSALLILVLGAGLMTLNPAGITAGLRDVQHQGFVNIQPTANAAPAGDLVPVNVAQIDTRIWAQNAAALWPELLYLFVAGALLVFLLARARPIWAALFAIVAIVAAVGGSWLLFMRQHLFIEVLMPVLVLGIALLIALLLRSAFAPRRPSPVRVVSPEIEPQVMPPAPVRPPLISRSRTVTYLACELRGIADPGGTLDASETMALLESSANPLLAAITQQRGTLVDVSGDRFAAVWNGSDDDAEHATHACEAALKMLATLTELKDQHGEGPPYDPVQIAIGIATGPVIFASAANAAGAPNTHSVVGNCTRMADLLSRLSARYGPAILLDEETQKLTDKTFAVLEIDTVAADPDGKAMRIYALYGNPLVRASPKFRALSSFHDHLFQAIRQKRWSDARTLIEQCNNLSGASPQLYDLHLARIGWYESHPPAADWDGAFRPPIA
ncbi:MAG: adenylate/guanylate cyclase domain-containing protein [Alphaproteobacteria bacterium]